MTDRVESTLAIGRVQAMMGVLRLSDEEAYNHSLSVAKITNSYLIEEEKKNLADRPETEKISIITGAILHDVGKAFLPFGLQYSSRKFDAAEAEIMNTHPILGLVALKNCEFDEIVNNIVLMHHAALDGSGYPAIANRVLGDHLDDRPEGYIQVPEYVWIVAYADKLDAMISRRNFKKAKNLKEAWASLVELSKNGGPLPYGPLNIYQKIIQDMNIFKGDWDDPPLQPDMIWKKKAAFTEKTDKY